MMMSTSTLISRILASERIFSWVLFNTKWGLVQCTKRNIRRIIIAIVTIRIIIRSQVKSLQSDLNEAATEEETSSLDTRFILGQKDSCSMRADCMEEVLANTPIHKSATQNFNMGNVCESIIFGTHHKTGTVLAKSLMRTMCPNFTMGKNFNPHMAPDDYVPVSPFVHFIRDPLEQVIVSTSHTLVFSNHNRYIVLTAHLYLYCSVCLPVSSSYKRKVAHCIWITR